MDQKAAIRQAYYVEHKSIRCIAQEMGLHRKTVRRALQDAHPPRYERPPRAAPILGTFHPIIREILLQDQQAPRKQRHTAKRIWERLCEEHGFRGGQTTVRQYVHKLKRELDLDQPEVYVPIVHPPNGRAQADWGMAVAQIGTQQTRVQFFALRLCHSGKAFVRAYPTQRTEALFDAHDQAFRFLDGIPPTVDYDNPKTMVKKILRGHARIEQEAFLAFRTHYLFEAHFCTPRAGNEKGGVENLIGFVQRNFFCPVPQVKSFEELNEYLLQRCRQQENRRIAHRSETIAQAFEHERSALRPLPAFPFDCCRRMEARVNSSSEVTFETNRYSVPVRWAYQPVTVKAYVDRIEVYHQDEKIAQHLRSYQRDQEFMDPVHYVPVLQRKPHTLEHGKPFQNWLLPGVFERFRKTVPMRVYIRLLQEIPNGGVDRVAEVLEQAIQQKLTSADEILQLMERSRSIGKLDLSHRSDLSGVVVPRTSLKVYNKLLSF